MLNSLIQMVRHQYGSTAQVYLLAHKMSIHIESFWRRHSAIDEIIFHETQDSFNNFIKLVTTVKKERFDTTIIYSLPTKNNLRTIYFPLGPALSYVLGMKTIIGFFDRWDEDLFVVKKTQYSSGHWTNIARSYGLALGIGNDEMAEFLRPWFPFKKVHLPLLEESTLTITLNHGGGRSWHRMWNFNRYVDLCVNILTKFKCKIVLLGGEEEFEERHEMAGLVRNRVEGGNIVNIRSSSLNEVVNYISQSDLFIGNDSGLTHIAVAVETPVVAIFGPSDARHLGPCGVSSIHTEVALGLDCQPCESLVNSTGRMDCFRIDEKFKCLNDLSLEQVWRAVDHKLQVFSKGRSQV